ncbi:MAG: CPBP family intramembrane metalloprotease [Clostridiaceae bacterium]|nr:CPBP family intramembrane metalloprotease [Clostridiaceae bacterium]
MSLIDLNKTPLEDGDTVLKSKYPRADVLTVAAPLLFMLLHALFLNLAAMGIVVIYTFVQGIPFSLLSSQEAIERLFLDAQAQNWASVLLGLVMVPVYSLYLKYRGRKYPEVVLLERVPRRYWLAAFSAIMGSLGLTMIWIGILIHLAQSNAWLQTQYDTYITAIQTLIQPEGYLWLEILAVVIMIPIAEELLFRGILQGEIRRVAPAWLAVLLSAVAFALFHLMPFQIAFVILPGLVLALVYELTRNLLIPIFMHMVYNFFGSGIFARLFGLPEDNLTLFWIEIVFIFIGLFMLIRLIGEYRYRRKQV